MVSIDFTRFKYDSGAILSRSRHRLRLTTQFMLAWPGVCKSQTTEEVSGFRSDWLPADFSCTFATYENLDDNCNRTIASVPGPWSPIQNHPQDLLTCQQHLKTPFPNAYETK